MAPHTTFAPTGEGNRAVAVRTVAGDRRNDDSEERFRRAGGRILLACWLTVILSVGFMGGNVEHTSARPFGVEGLNAIADRVVLRLQDPATRPHRAWLRGVDPIENAPGTGRARVAARGNVAGADDSAGRAM